MLKSLTLWEPFATLMAIGAKKIETRGWSTDYRGPVAIHAAKGGLTQMDLEATCREEEFFYALKKFEPFRETSHYLHGNLKGVFPFGHVIAVGELSDCFKSDHLEVRSKFFPLSEQERAFGDYGPGRFGLVFTNMCRLATPVPFKSRQGKLIDLDLTAEWAVTGQWWPRCCSCPADKHEERTHEVERGSHYCRGCYSIHDLKAASHGVMA